MFSLLCTDQSHQLPSRVLEYRRPADRQAGRMAWVRDPGAAFLCFISCTTSSFSNHLVVHTKCRSFFADGISTCLQLDKFRVLVNEMTAPSPVKVACGAKVISRLEGRTDKLPLHMQVNTVHVRVPCSPVRVVGMHAFVYVFFVCLGVTAQLTRLTTNKPACI